MLLCCGEALIDMIPTPTDTGRIGYVPHSGGAVFNTAIALGRLGVQTGMLTGLSTDLFGQQLTTALETGHIDTTHVIRCERPTTLAFVTLTDGQATYEFFDENSAGRMLQPSDIPSLAADITALYLGGISLACEPCADAYAALASRESASRVIMLDPNIRPGFIRDIDRYRNRLDSMIARADIVKVSDEDLNWIHPGPESLVDKLAKIRAAGPSVVILTCGVDGATALLAEAEVTVPVKRVEVVDTVGAGDTFNAGVLARLSEMGFLRKKALSQITPYEMRSALEFGARIAAVTVSRAGANSPWTHEVRS